MKTVCQSNVKVRIENHLAVCCSVIFDICKYCDIFSVYVLVLLERGVDLKITLAETAAAFDLLIDAFVLDLIKVHWF